MTRPVPDFLIHDVGDDVGVATRDLSPGDVTGGYLEGDESVTVPLRDTVPLGHKFALTEIAEGAEVTEYGVGVAIASAAIPTGSHAHVHNLRSVRWQSSIAN